VLVAKPSFIWWLLRWLCLFVWAVALAHGPSLVLKRCETKVCVDIVVSFYHEMEPGRCLPVNLKKKLAPHTIQEFFGGYSLRTRFSNLLSFFERISETI
jgi:hypothetical protein